MVIRLLIIFITTLFFYRRTVKYGYIIDDLAVSLQDEIPDNFWKRLWWQVKGGVYFNRETEHTITLLFHVLNSLLVYLAFGANNVSFLAAMLFSINPVNNQASVWLSGKVYSIATTFVLLGMWLKLLFPIVYFLGFYFSLNVVLVPLLFLFIKPHLFVLLPLLLAFSFKERIVKEPKRRFKQGSPFMREMSFRKIMISIKTLGYYFRLCLFPFKLAMCHKYLHEYGLSKNETEKWYTFDKYFWLGIGVLLTLGIGLLKGWDVFGLLWFTLLMAQWCNFLILNHPICERYAYLANVGLMFMLAKVLFAIPYGLYIACLIYGFYVTKLWLFLPSYFNNYAYFRNNKQEFSNVAIAYNQEGLEATHFGQPNIALDIFMQGIFYRPSDFRLNYNAANLLVGTGKYDQAKFFIHRAEQSLDKDVDNRQMWLDNINTMKKFLRERGINVV